MLQSTSTRFLSHALTCALTCALAGCSASDTAQSGFNQVVSSDASAVSLDGLGGMDGTALDGGVVLGDTQVVDVQGDVSSMDGGPDDGSLDGSLGDASAEVSEEDAGSLDVPSEDGVPGDTPSEDVNPGDTPAEDMGLGDVPAEDAIGPDGGDVVPECEESVDCEGVLVELPTCMSVMCLEGACVEIPSKLGSACDLSPEELLGGCTVGTCDGAGLCTGQVVVDVACEDGDPCTQGETCTADGLCQGGSPLVCSPPGPCQASVCDAGVGGCVAFPSWEGQACNDLDPCTTDTVCNSGVCGGGDNQCICETDEDCPDDGDLCNGAPVCALQADGGKACELPPESVVVCQAPESDCVTVSCEPSTGACIEKSLAGASCTDGNLCTLNDTCDDGGQCVGVSLGCEDEDPCTEDSCVPSTGTCLFEPSSGSSCSDGDVCTTGDVCSSGVCQGEDKLCDDGNPCTIDSCDPETGSCVSVPTPELDCDDANACTSGDMCDANGLCLGQAISCEDENPCTGSQCDPTEGCVYDPLEIPCDDGNACTGPDLCNGGACEPPALVCDDGVSCTVDTCNQEGGCVHEVDQEACDDQNPCTSDACEPSAGCIFSPLSSGGCDDESACTLEDSCVGGACIGKNIDCEDGVACTINSCDPLAGCVLESDAGACDDGNPCTDEICDEEAGCLSEDNDANCEDGSDCTEGDLCSQGACQPGNNSCVCDPDAGPQFFWSAGDGDDEADFYDLFQQTFSTLDPGQEMTFSETAITFTGASYSGQVLSFEMDSIAGLEQAKVAWHLGGASIEGSGLFLFWEDSEGAFHNLFCVDDGIESMGWEDEELAQVPYACEESGTNFNVLGESQFAPGEEPQKLHLRMFMFAVPGGDAFYVYELGVTGALFQAEACNDGDLCNGVFACAESADGSGACEAIEAPVVCDEQLDDPCLTSACDPDTGLCTVVPVADGTSCEDSNPCTTNEVCVSGACTSTSVECQDDIDCTIDLCDPQNGGCIFLPGDQDCSDGVQCTVDTCDPSQGCVFTASAGACDDGEACTLDKCDADEGCSYEAVDAACDDGIACTVDSCSIDFGCVFDPESSNCVDGNPCTQDVCLGGEGCVHQPTPGACEDGNPCTLDDSCSNGVCASGLVNPCDSQSPCEAGQCDVATGDCAYLVLANGTACEDGDACSNPDVCEEGVCQAGPTDSCDDGIACTNDSCEAGEGCVNLPGDGACNDNNPCTVDICDPQDGCQHLLAPEFSPCSDGLEGTGPDVCVQGLCHGFQTSEISYDGDWFCDAYESVGRALEAYSGQVFAVVNYGVDGFWCGGVRSQVVRLNGANSEGVVVNSTNDVELTSMAYDGVFSVEGVVGQFVWGVVSISYNLGDLIGAFNNQGEHYGAWAGHLKHGDDIKHRTYVVGEHHNGNKGRIRRCIRTNDGNVSCTNVSNGLKSSEQEYYRPVAVDGLVMANPECNGDAACDDLYVGLAAVSNDIDGLASLVWGNGSDKFDYTLIDDVNEVFDVQRAGSSNIWISGDQGYLARFDGEDTWTLLEGPAAMGGLDLTSLGRVSGHTLVAGHWSEDESGEAFLFVLPAGSNATDSEAWVTVPLGLNRQVRALHVDGDGLTVLGRQATPETQPVVFVWYLKL